MTLDGETALVTGASSGIGRATALALAEAGADVVVAARREERLAELVADVEAETDAAALAVPTDVTDHEQVEALVEATVEEFGGLDVAVVNAGLGRAGRVAELPLEDYRTMMSVNCDGAFYTARAAAPHLEDSEGNLVFVASFAGKYPRPHSPVYAATKWWVRGLAHSLAGSLGERGVGVTAVNLSEVRTQFGGEESMAESHEPGSATEPEDVAAAIRFAAEQDPPNVVHELDLFRRDKLSHF